MAQTATLHQLSVLVQKLSERQGGRELVLIDGYPAAGKTTFAMELAALPRVSWTPAEIFMTDGRLDTRKMRRDLIRPFRREGKVREVVPSMSGSGLQRGRPQSGTRVLIIEGMGVAEAARTLRADQVWWMDCDTEIRAERMTTGSSAGIPGATFSDMKHRMIQAEAADLRTRALKVTDVIVSTDHEPLPRIDPGEVPADATAETPVQQPLDVPTNATMSNGTSSNGVAAHAVAANGAGPDGSANGMGVNGHGPDQGAHDDAAKVAAVLGSTSALLGGLKNRSDSTDESMGLDLEEFNDELPQEKKRPIPGSTPLPGQIDNAAERAAKAAKAQRPVPGAGAPKLDLEGFDPLDEGESLLDEADPNVTIDLTPEFDDPDEAELSEQDDLLPVSSNGVLADEDVLADGDMIDDDLLGDLLPGSALDGDAAGDDPLTGLMPGWLDD